MCGRFGYDHVELVETRFQAELLPDVKPEVLTPRFNIAPTQDVLAVATSKRLGGRRGVKAMRWGLTQEWAVKDRSKPRPINVKTEGILDRPNYRRLLSLKRCVIPADGFYEWRRLGGKATQPYSIGLRDGAQFGFAGIWDAVRTGPGNDDWLVSCAILTCAPNPLVAQLHDRMPVILPPDEEDAWLDDALTDFADLAPLLVALPEQVMAMYPVLNLVNNVDNEGAALRTRADAQEQLALEA
ncbi:MAG: SOS response-associated peptidase [Chloroflexi bacterium]|nr:SOS response-associated peptidase [Chloroflexota bacterium]